MKNLGKRLCSFLLSLTMILGMLPFVPSVFALSAPTWSTEQVTAVAGKDVTVNIILSNAADVYGGNFTLQYDNTILEATSCSYDAKIDNYTKNCNLNYQSTGNQIRFTFSGSEALGEDGTVLSITFSVMDEASGTSNLEFTSYKLYGTNGASLSASANNGSITVKEMKKIYLDTSVDVTVSDDEPISYLYFTPEESGVYHFYSTSDVDTYGYILDENENELDENDDGGINNNFKVSCALTAGQTYIMMSRLYSYGSGSYTVIVEKSNISSVTFNDVSVIEGYDSNTENAYNEETGEYDLQWERYYYSVSGIITFADGSTAEFEDGCYHENDNWNYVEYSDGQSYNSPWAVGNTYNVTGTLMGATNTFSVTVVQNPIKKVEVTNLSFIEGTNQDTAWDWIDGEDVEYLKYYYNTPTYTVTFQDDTTQTVEYGGSININGEDYWLNTWDDQSSTNIWDVGKHTVNASLMGVETTFTVEITKSPIASISASNVSMTIGTNGYYSSHTDEYGNETVWYRYSYQPIITVTYQDGSTEQINGGIYIGDDWYSPDYDDDQSYSTPWGVGKHTANVRLLGATTTFEVEITESPIANIVINKDTVTEGISGWENTRYDDETDSYITYFEYGYDPSFTVTMKDGTVYNSQNSRYDNHYIVIDDEWYYLNFTDTQSESPWGVGEHTVTATILGVSSEFTVEVVTSPIVSVKFDDISLTENYDGWRYYEYNPETDEYDIPYFYYDYTPSCTVTLSDGTTLKSEDGYVTYDDDHYWIDWTDTQEETHWSVGTYSVEAELFGFEGTFDITINESPYESLTISGTTELVITLTKKNGETETMTATGFEYYGGGQGERGGKLYTTSKTFDMVNFTFYETDEGEAQYDTDLVLTIGNYVSNSLDGNTWFKATMLADDYLYTSLSYRYSSEEIFDERFENFEGEVTDKNIDDIVILAANICSDIWYVDDYVTIDDYEYAIMDVETVMENIERVFGITEIDLTKASGYSSTNPAVIKVLVLSFGGDGSATKELYYDEGHWIYEFTPDPDEWVTDYDSVKIVMNENVKIETIEFIGSVIIPKLTAIEIATEATKTTYEIGETIDSSGLSIKLLYSDGSSEIITDGFVVSGFDSTTAGSKTLLITYEGFTTSYVVSVVEKEILETDPQIIVSSVTANRGKQVKVSISLKNNPGIASATLRVKYNSDAMTLIGVEDAGNLGTTVHSDQFTNPYVLNWVNDTITENITYNGEIVTLTFLIADDATFGAYAVNVYYDYANYDIYNVDAQKVKLYSVDGTVNVVDTIIGDVNSDGVVNNLDRMVLTRYLANWQNYTDESIDKVAADVNSDGVVNNLDRMVLTRYLANWQGYDELPHVS